MKKRILSLIVLLAVLCVSAGLADTYTLPVKMSNQLAIGSGLKAAFIIRTEGEKFSTPFMKLISDAEFMVRGISSGEDFHYYIFQTDEAEQQTGLSELYRKDGSYYFRSDMVPGKILTFPKTDRYLDTLFPSRGENISPASFITKIMTLPEEVKKAKWEPVLSKYQLELEMWLARYTIEEEIVKLDKNQSAIQFSYNIPMKDVTKEIIKLYTKILDDKDAVALLDTVMTKEEKKVYANKNLMYFYEEALKAADQSKTVSMSKQISMGEMISFRLNLPMNEQASGFSSIRIESENKVTRYTLNSEKQYLMIAIPDSFDPEKESFKKSAWLTRITNGSEKEEGQEDISVRIDIQKTGKTYNDEQDYAHETDDYHVIVRQDTAYLPNGYEAESLPEFPEITADISLHYYSKYAQSAATTLDITADVRQADSSLKLEAKLKTASPWLFMPFEVTDPIDIGTDAQKVLVPYLTDWIANAASIIRHTDGTTAAETEAESIPPEENTEEPAEEETEDLPEAEDEGESSEAESIPLDDEPEEDGTEDEESPEAESIPLEDDSDGEAETELPGESGQL